jgi:hypothetical protein
VPFLILIGVIALVPFAIAVVMPGGIWLGLYAVAASVAVIWLHGSDAFDGPLGLFGLLLWLSIVVATATGIVARAIELGIHAYNGHRTRVPTLAACLCFCAGAFWIAVTVT